MEALTPVDGRHSCMPSGGDPSVGQEKDLMKILSLEDIINLEANSPSMDRQRFPFHFLKVTPTGTKRSSRPFPGVLCLPQPCLKALPALLHSREVSLRPLQQEPAHGFEMLRDNGVPRVLNTAPMKIQSGQRWPGWAYQGLALTSHGTIFVFWGQPPCLHVRTRRPTGWNLYTAGL